jgi:hypothetical protein
MFEDLSVLWTVKRALFDDPDFHDAEAARWAGSMAWSAYFYSLSAIFRSAARREKRRRHLCY